MEKNFTAVDLLPLVQEIAKGDENPKPEANWADDEVTDRVFIGTEGAELEILRWSQGPEFFF
jgi:hypothetical protein